MNGDLLQFASYFHFRSNQIADVDHQLAGVDHQLAGVDHQLAGVDHQLAGVNHQFSTYVDTHLQPNVATAKYSVHSQIGLKNYRAASAGERGGSHIGPKKTVCVAA